MLARHRLARRIRRTPDVDPAIADAMIATPRHRFVRWRYRLRAYRDFSLPTGDGTTISQPTYVARVLSAARVTRGDNVLEIGCGSGWTAAILARVARSVVTVDCVPDLIERARPRLAHLRNVRVVEGDGVHAVDGTFDVIFVMCGGPRVPPSFTERLRDGGRLVMPVGRRRSARGMHGNVVRVTRHGDTFIEVPLFEGDWNTLGGVDGY